MLMKSPARGDFTMPVKNKAYKNSTALTLLQESYELNLEGLILVFLQHIDSPFQCPGQTTFLNI